MAIAWTRSPTDGCCSKNPVARRGRRRCRISRLLFQPRTHPGGDAMRAVAAVALGLLVVLSPSLAPSQEGGCRDRLPADRTTVELRGADAPTTLRLLAERYRVSLILTPDVAGTITMSLYEVPARDVFEAMLRTVGLSCVVRDGILFVTTAERIRKEAEAVRTQERVEQEARDKVAREKASADADIQKKQVEARQAEAAF